MKPPKKVTPAWAERRYACPSIARRFFAEWPNGLTVTRKNLMRAAEVVPPSAILWFLFRTRDYLSTYRIPQDFEVAFGRRPDVCRKGTRLARAWATFAADALELP